MTTQEYENKYLNKVIGHATPFNKAVYGKVDTINRETSFGAPVIIWTMNNARYEAEEEWFLENTIVL